jgi:hypothetical protein
VAPGGRHFQKPDLLRRTFHDPGTFAFYAAGFPLTFGAWLNQF